jgi:hypothetical protein
MEADGTTEYVMTAAPVAPSLDLAAVGRATRTTRGCTTRAFAAARARCHQLSLHVAVVRRRRRIDAVSHAPGAPDAANPPRPYDQDMSRALCVGRFLLALLVAAPVTAGLLTPVHLVVRGPLVDARDWLSVSVRSVALVSVDGAVRWRWHPPAATNRVWFMAAGDLDGDHVNEVALAVYRPLKRRCGGLPRASSAIYVLNGRTGTASQYGPRLDDICFAFPSSTYPQDQWMPGSVTIGSETLVAFPTYATVGYMWHAGVEQELVFPSTPAYDRAFPSCHKASGSTSCYVPNSHIANVVFVPGGLLMLTSYRALTYGNGRPVDDLTWVSGTTPNAGRNKGFLFTFVDRGRRYAELIGGCTVADEQRAMRLHVLPSGTIGNCSIHHHFEWFELQGLQITAHANRYYGYIGTDGYLRNRLEAPAPANGPVGGRAKHWTLFNWFDGRRWTLELLPDPAHPETIINMPGWYAWGIADPHGTGQADVLATRGSGYFLPWSFAVLKWHAGRFTTVVRASNLLPTLLQYPDLPDQHFSDSRSYAVPSEAGESRFGIDISNGRLLVETRAGRRFWLRWNDIHITRTPHRQSAAVSDRKRQVHTSALGSREGALTG